MAFKFPADYVEGSEATTAYGRSIKYTGGRWRLMNAANAGAGGGGPADAINQLGVVTEVNERLFGVDDSADLYYNTDRDRLMFQPSGQPLAIEV